MTKAKIDPVDKDKEQNQGQLVEQEDKSLSMTELSEEDFGSISAATANTVHPFEGYPLDKIKIKGFENPMVKAFIMALKPMTEVFQDPSGKGVSIVSKKTGRTIKADLKTFHSRMIRDYDDNKHTNTEVVFDRELTFGNKTLMCAYVPSHSVRAQMAYEYDHKTERVKVNPDYVLADVKQASRLRDLFQIIINPRLKKERDAKLISSEE
jgi:hypothetical protein